MLFEDAGGAMAPEEAGHQPLQADRRKSISSRDVLPTPAPVRIFADVMKSTPPVDNWSVQSDPVFKVPAQLPAGRSPQPLRAGWPLDLLLVPGLGSKP